MWRDRLVVMTMTGLFGSSSQGQGGTQHLAIASHCIFLFLDDPSDSLALEKGQMRWVCLYFYIAVYIL